MITSYINTLFLMTFLCNNKFESLIGEHFREMLFKTIEFCNITHSVYRKKFLLHIDVYRIFSFIFTIFKLFLYGKKKEMFENKTDIDFVESIRGEIKRFFAALLL